MLEKSETKLRRLLPLPVLTLKRILNALNYLTYLINIPNKETTRVCLRDL